MHYHTPMRSSKQIAVQVRITPAQDKAWKAAAARKGQSFSEWARTVLDRASKAKR